MEEFLEEYDKKKYLLYAMNPVLRLPFYFSFIFYDDLIIIASDNFMLSWNNLHNLLVRKHENGSKLPTKSETVYLCYYILYLSGI